VFLIFSASFFLVFFDRSFYNKEFEKYEQYDELGVQGVRNTVDYLIKYLTSENTKIEKAEGLSIFLPEERSHLEDVHRLISLVKFLAIGSVLIVALLIFRLSRLKGFKDNLRRVLIYSSISSLAIILIFFVLGLNFPAFFEGFHKLLFPQGNYTFPAHYLLIKLFPEAFFNDYAKKMFFHAIIISLMLLFLGSSSAFSFRNARRH
jgi:integral membrane protein (TIGR01906 family)